MGLQSPSKSLKGFFWQEGGYTRSVWRGCLKWKQKKKNGVWWQLIFLPAPFACCLVMSLMAFSPFVTLSAEWYNWAGGHIFLLPCWAMTRKERGFWTSAVSPSVCSATCFQVVFYWERWWFSDASLCLCKQFSVAMPSPEYSAKLKDGVTPTQSVLPLAGAGGNGQNPSQRLWMGWHLKEGKAEATKRGLKGLDSLEQTCTAKLGVGIAQLSNSEDLFAVLALQIVNKCYC